MGLAIGVIIGFVFANKVIDVVVAPLEASIREYFIDRTVDNLKADYGGGMSEEELASLEQSIRDQQRVFQFVYLERSELRRILQIAGEGAPSDSAAMSEPGVPTFDFIKVRQWRDTNYKTQSISMTEGFMSWMKVGIISGLTIAAPWIFWQLWIFVAEGLYPSEKKYVYLYLPFSLALFCAGASLAYFFVFDPVLGFLLSFNETMNAEPQLRIYEWLSFFLLLPLGFGIGFQLPLVMLFLNRIGILSVEVYISQWRIAILVIAFAAMLLTPADPQSMLLLAVPLTVLYFLGILLCKYLPQRQSPFGDAYDPS